MHHWLLLTPLLFSLASGQLYYQMRFRPDAGKLSKCMRDHKALNLFQFYDMGIVRAIADVSARRFHGNISDIESLGIGVAILIQDMQNDWRYHQLRDNREFWAEFRKAAEMALMHCSEPLDDNQISEYPLPLPEFYREPPEIANFLNFVLVRWTLPLQEMIRTRLGRSILRNFARDARAALNCALDSVESVTRFRTLIRRFWRRRAELYFDESDTHNQYIPHRYNLANQFLFRYHRLNTFSRMGNFAQRNHLVAPELVNRILGIHGADRDGQMDIFGEYDQNGMHASEYLLETQLDQLYRILFFDEEAQASGIASDEDDIYDGPMPDRVMSNGVQVLLFDDIAYGQYLQVRRRLEVGMGDRQNPLIQRLDDTARVCEEYILLLPKGHPFSNLEISVGQPIATTTTTIRPVSSTPRNEGSSRVRAGSSRNQVGKCYSESYGYSNGESTSNGNTNFKYTDSCLQKLHLRKTEAISPSDPASELCSIVREVRKNPNRARKVNRKYFGYVEDIDKMPEPFEESTMFLNTLVTAVTMWNH